MMEFFREFPDDDACLNWLWRNRYSKDGETAHCPRCDKQRTFKHYKTSRRRQVWSCTACAYQISPTAGTIFHKSSTSLQLWFYAMWIITSTRCGVSAKQLERELGVTYKTAWRMFNKIRNKLMVQDGGKLDGVVEVDETWIGGKLRESEKRDLAKRRAAGEDIPKFGPYVKTRATVQGMVSRGGEVRAMTVPEGRYGYPLRRNVMSHVLPKSLIYTDDWSGYNGLERRYHHERVNHSQRVYVAGDCHTQTIEGFFSLVKRGIDGVYHSVSAKWLQGYLNEYVWRYNHRDDRYAMFRTLLLRAATSQA